MPQTSWAERNARRTAPPSRYPPLDPNAPWAERNNRERNEPGYLEKAVNWGWDFTKRTGGHLADMARGMWDLAPVNQMGREQDLLKLYETDPVAAEQITRQRNQAFKEQVLDHPISSGARAIGYGVAPELAGMGEAAYGIGSDIYHGEGAKALAASLPFIAGYGLSKYAGRNAGRTVPPGNIPRPAAAPSAAATVGNVLHDQPSTSFPLAYGEVNPWTGEVGMIPRAASEAPKLAYGEVNPYTGEVGMVPRSAKENPALAHGEVNPYTGEVGFDPNTPVTRTPPPNAKATPAQKTGALKGLAAQVEELNRREASPVDPVLARIREAYPEQPDNFIRVLGKKGNGYLVETKSHGRVVIDADTVDALIGDRPNRMRPPSAEAQAASKPVPKVAPKVTPTGRTNPLAYGEVDEATGEVGQIPRSPKENPPLAYGEVNPYTGEVGITPDKPLPPVNTGVVPPVKRAMPKVEPTTLTSEETAVAKDNLKRQQDAYGVMKLLKDELDNPNASHTTRKEAYASAMASIEAMDTAEKATSASQVFNRAARLAKNNSMKNLFDLLAKAADRKADSLANNTGIPAGKVVSEVVKGGELESLKKVAGSPEATDVTISKALFDLSHVIDAATDASQLKSIGREVMNAQRSVKNPQLMGKFDNYLRYIAKRIASLEKEPPPTGGGPKGKKLPAIDTTVVGEQPKGRLVKGRRTIKAEEELPPVSGGSGVHEIPEGWEDISTEATPNVARDPKTGWYMDLETGEKFPPVSGGSGGSGSTAGKVTSLPKTPKKKSVPVAPVYGSVGKTLFGRSARIGYKKFMEQNPRLKGFVDDFIRARDADRYIVENVRKKFGHLKEFTKDRIVELQDRMNNGEFPEVREFFDKLHDRMTAKGLDVPFKKGYLPQFFNEPKQIVLSKAGKQLNKKARFQYESLFPDYKTAEAQGLTAKYGLLELMEDYAKRSNKLIADNKLVNNLIQSGYFTKSKKTPSNYVGMNDRVSTFGDISETTADGQKVKNKVVSEWKMDPSIKTVLRNYLDDTSGSISSRFNEVWGRMANLRLSAGIPHFPLMTMRGMSIAFPFRGRAWQEGGFTRMGQALKYAANYKSAGRALQKNAALREFFSKNFGYSDSMSEHPIHPKFFEDTSGNMVTGNLKKGVNWLSEHQYNFFEKPLLENTVPAIKFEATVDAFKRYRKSGMSIKEAGTRAVKWGDTWYGGENVNLLYRNKNFGNFIRGTFLSPSWLKSNFKIGENVVRAFTDKNMPWAERQKYYLAIGKVMATYGAADLLQKSLTGKYMHDNPPGHKFDVIAGTDSNGKEARWKVFLGSADWLELPVELGAAGYAASQGDEYANPLTIGKDYLQNRASIPVGAIVGGFSGEDYLGRPNMFRDRDDNNQPIPWGGKQGKIMNTVGQGISYGPPQISALYDLGMGRTGKGEAASRAFELGINFGKPKKNPFVPSLQFQPLTPKFSNPNPMYTSPYR